MAVFVEGNAEALLHSDTGNNGFTIHLIHLVIRRRN